MEYWEVICDLGFQCVWTHALSISGQCLNRANPGTHQQRGRQYAGRRSDRVDVAISFQDQLNEHLTYDFVKLMSQLSQFSHRLTVKHRLSRQFMNKFLLTHKNDSDKITTV